MVDRKNSLTKFLPVSSLRTEEERRSFCLEVLGGHWQSLSYCHLLEKTIYNLGFVYEEGNETFRKEDVNGKLTNLGILNPVRWRSGISVIHFLFPSDKQASNTRTAEGPHGQATFVDFVWAMDLYEGPDITFRFYGPNENHSTNFLFVLNGAAALKYTLAINRHQMKERINQDAPSLAPTSTQQQVAGNYSDYGFCLIGHP